MIISISGLVVEYIVAIDVTRVQFPADAIQIAECNHFVKRFIKQHLFALNARIETCILNIMFWCVSFVALLRFFCLFWHAQLISEWCTHRFVKYVMLQFHVRHARRHKSSGLADVFHQ